MDRYKVLMLIGTGIIVVCNLINVVINWMVNV